MGLISKQTSLNLCGVCVLVWTIWNCHNDVVVNRNVEPNFLQVIHKVVSSIHLWSYLLPPEQCGPMDIGCNWLMAVIRAIFSQGGWLHTNRIKDA
jgi:hypothetical protein